MNMRSLLIKEGEKNSQIWPKVYGGRLIDSCAYSTQEGGFILFKTESNTSIIMRILEIKKDPLSIIVCKCSKVSTNAFNHEVYELTNETRDIAAELSQVQSVLNMQHLCDESCNAGIVLKKVENKMVSCEQMIHSDSQKYVLNSFCFSR